MCQAICHAYWLTAHDHLSIETPKVNLPIGMRQLNGIYTESFNRRHNRVGHIYQGRFKGILVEKESHLLELCRIYRTNPLRIKSSAGHKPGSGAVTSQPLDWLQFQAF